MSPSSVPPTSIPLSPPSLIPSYLILVRLTITAGAKKAAFSWDRKIDSSRQGYFYIPRPFAIFVVITRNWILKYVNTLERIRDTFSFRHVAYLNCLLNFTAGIITNTGRRQEDWRLCMLRQRQKLFRSLSLQETDAENYPDKIFWQTAFKSAHFSRQTK